MLVSSDMMGKQFGRSGVYVESRVPGKTANAKEDSLQSPSLDCACVYMWMRSDAFVQTSVTGAGKRLFGRFQMEQALHRDRHLLLFHLFRKFLEFAGQRTCNSACNATGNIS